MPFIQISQLSGLDTDQKRSVIEAVTRAYTDATGKDAATVWVTITDVAPDSWGIAGVPLG